VLQADALRWLARETPTAFDVVFLDPPFEKPVIARAYLLLQRGWLAPGAAVYSETPAKIPPPALPEGWALDRERTAGQVRYALARAPA
jgi:16S rRNA (guanine966-N2)-methyltransferase